MRRAGRVIHFLFVAHGGLPSDTRKTVADNDVVSRFRSYNLTHSEVLADILDVAPLTRAKVERILEKMDSIGVRLHQAVFGICGRMYDIARDLPGVEGTHSHRTIQREFRVAAFPRTDAPRTDV